jgi:16S rRNA (adenine1518-N6/adenine1519-N6)-dimethyltransferase
MTNPLFNLPSLPSLIEKFKITPDKKLGQNFLLDTDLTDKIVAAAQIKQGDVVLEVGPGIGTLTRSILFKNPSKLYSVERDERCLAVLADLEKALPRQFNLIHADALKMNELSLDPIPDKIVANLPYNIGTELLFKWIEMERKFKSITIMLQREVVDRISAKPGSGDFGRLAILSQLFYDAEKHFDVEPEAFFPAPKVVSSVVSLRLKPKAEIGVDLSQLKFLISILFSGKRKMVRNTLKKYVDEAKMEEMGIDPKLRPQDLTIEQVCSLARLKFIK